MPEDRAEYTKWALEADEIATNRLREQLPGLTKPEATRRGLFDLVENHVKTILSKGRIRDIWEYIVLRHFTSYPDMPLPVRTRDDVREIIERFRRQHGLACE
jgi:hypothetical protein